MKGDTIVEDLSKSLSVEQGVIKGSMQQKVETAKNLLNRGLTIEEIAEDTGLKQCAVEKLLT